MKIRAVFLTLFFGPFIGLAQEIKTIVFVCEHGGARSIIASLYFNKMAKENHIQYRSVFRGLVPDSVITTQTAAGLRADGFETTPLTPLALSAQDFSKDILLISLDCKPPSTFQTYLTWNGIPPISENYVAARNEIVRRLNELIIDLKKRK